MAWVNIVELIYPVGAVYTSADSTSPADLFGGSWVDITAEGATLYSWKRIS